MSDLDGYLLRRLLPGILSCGCEPTIARSGEDGEAVNCFTARTQDPAGRRFVLLNVDGSQVVALEHDGDTYSVPSVIGIESINPRTLHVTHYFGLETVHYLGVRDLARGRYLRLPYVQIRLVRLWNRLAQQLFNRRKLVSKRRSDLLAEVVHLVEDGAASVGSMDIMSARYGPRWAEHPGWERLDRQIAFHLAMLVDSGELERVNHRFRPTGLALKAIEETDEQERRHKENLRVQFVLGVLALGSLAMAAAQAGLVRFPTLLDLSKALGKG